jgi:hypothetical protein
VHQLRNARRVIPPVDVEHINVIRLEFLQTSFKRMLQSLCMHAPEVGLDDVFALVAFVGPVCSGEFRGDDHLISTIAFRHPLANPRLGLFILVVAGGVDKITATARGRSA